MEKERVFQNFISTFFEYYKYDATVTKAKVGICINEIVQE